MVQSHPSFNTPMKIEIVVQNEAIGGNTVFCRWSKAVFRNVF